MKSIYIFLVTAILLTSCGASVEEKKPTSTGSTQNSPTLSSTGGVWWENDVLSDEKLLEALITENEVLEIFKKRESGGYYEEVPRIQSYYTDRAFYEFHILNSIKTKNNQCSKIEDDKNKTLCNNLVMSFGTWSKEDFIKAFVQWWDNEKYANSFFKILQDITKNNNCPEYSEPIEYLMCKKMFNQKFDAMQYFMKYSILDNSNAELVKKEYKKIITLWWLDQDFITLIWKSVVTKTR